MDKRNQGQKTACARFDFMDMLSHIPRAGKRPANDFTLRFSKEFRDMKALRLSSGFGFLRGKSCRRLFGACNALADFALLFGILSSLEHIHKIVSWLGKAHISAFAEKTPAPSLGLWACSKTLAGIKRTLGPARRPSRCLAEKPCP
jgi:hypothetical protein